jgi:nucleotide-binding universal stress UspA family protein
MNTESQHSNFIECEGKMYKKILVPLDGSERAEAIAPYVEELAKAHDSLVIFLQVLEPGQTLPLADPAGVDLWLREIRRLRKEAHAYVERWAEAFRKQNIEADCRVEQGRIVDMIVGCAANENVDLIAMASHGRTGLERVVYGSVAAGVLQRIDRPLLLIRA